MTMDAFEQRQADAWGDLPGDPNLTPGEVAEMQDRAAAVGDVPADVEIDDTETAPR